MSQLPHEIGLLSAAEKYELLDELWESLEADLPALTAEQGEELDAREARYRDDRENVAPWEHVRADLFKKR
ncbi:MAG: addiction module protein [Acidobacteriaceae bacterium]|nr:addiction module protein [Acidobacteriaceae bacterium]